MSPDPYRDRKPVHLAAQMRSDGRVSAACYVRPRAISPSVATWTLTRRFVTCPKCLALTGEGEPSPVG